MANGQGYDFICIGAGIGGLTAAVTAHELGMSVLVIEKTDKLGGVAALSGGQCWVPANHLARRAGIDDSVEDGLAYMLWAGGGLADEALARNYCERTREAVAFLEAHAGVTWSLVPMPDPLQGFADSVCALAEGRLLEVQLFPGASLGSLRESTRKNQYGEVLTANEQYGTLPSPETLADRRERDDRAMGGSLIGPLVHDVIERGIEVWTGTEVEALLTEDHVVTGVRVAAASGPVTVDANFGVLIATGGYDAGPDYLAMFEASSSPASVALASVTGDHFRLAGIIGAKVASPFRVRHIFLEADVPPDRDADGTAMRVGNVVKPGFPHMIVVNRYGRRFFDESSNSARDAAMISIDLERPWRLANNPCWALWDAQHVDRYIRREEWDLSGVFSGSDLGELARKADLPADALIDQVERFNRFVDNGVDEEFGRGERLPDKMYGDHRASGSANLGRIDHPPFYCARMVPKAMGISSAGLVTDANSQVIDWHDAPIGGLYAAGNSVAMLELGLAYTGGNANGRGILHGFCAAEHAAATKREAEAAR